jgi:hypothetical protein
MRWRDETGVWSQVNKFESILMLSAYIAYIFVCGFWGTFEKMCGVQSPTTGPPPASLGSPMIVEVVCVPVVLCRRCVIVVCAQMAATKKVAPAPMNDQAAEVRAPTPNDTTVVMRMSESIEGHSSVS